VQRPQSVAAPSPRRRLAPTSPRRRPHRPPMCCSPPCQVHPHGVNLLLPVPGERRATTSNSVTQLALSSLPVGSRGADRRSRPTLGTCSGPASPAVGDQLGGQFVSGGGRVGGDDHGFDLRRGRRWGRR
jgi:hypothetical protein